MAGSSGKEGADRGLMAVQEEFPVEIVGSGERIAAETAMAVAHWLRAGYLWEGIS